MIKNHKIKKKLMIIKNLKVIKKLIMTKNHKVKKKLIFNQKILKIIIILQRKIWSQKLNEKNLIQYL